MNQLLTQVLETKQHFLKNNQSLSCLTAVLVVIVTLLCWSDLTKKGANMNNRTKEYGWRQNKDYVGGATC